MQTALITGATSGIGLCFAQELAADGYRLVLVARTLPRLASTASALRAEFGVEVSVLGADLSTQEGIDAAVELIDDEQIDVVVNNAGYGLPTSAMRSTPDELEALDRVHNLAVQEISLAAAHRMVERGRGGILTVSSLAGLTTMGAYAAAKSASLVFTESLAAELAHTPVTVTAVLPGFVRTEFHERIKADMSAFPSLAWVGAEQVARQGLRDARAGRTVSVAGAQYRLAYALAQMLPRPVIRRVSAAFSRSRGRRSAGASRL